MNTELKFLALFFAITLTFISCKKDETPEPQPEPIFTSGKTAFILNEGTFSQGNSEISYLNINDLTITNGLYGVYNSSAALGDIATSMTIIGDKAYIVVNNSQKVIVVTLSDFKKTATIAPLISPRYLQKVANNKAYVTDLFSNSISIVNLATNTVAGSINIGSWTEQMIVSGSKVFVSAPMTNKIYVIDAASDLLTDSIAVTDGVNSLCTDKNKNIWAFCSGNGAINAGVYCIDPNTNSILKTMDAGASTYSYGRICTNTAKDSIYYIKEDVYRLAILDATISTTPYLPFGSSSLYGLKVKDNYVMVTDAKDFVQKGEMKIYSKGGTLLKSLETGVNPGEILLY